MECFVYEECSSRCGKGLEGEGLVSSDGTPNKHEGEVFLMIVNRCAAKDEPNSRCPTMRTKYEF